MEIVKKIIRRPPEASNMEMISLLREIKKELIIERKTKLKNALVLATAIVMFAVPLNFVVEVTSNYIDSSSTGDLKFMDYKTVYYWLFMISIVFVISAFTQFFKPMSRIFMDSFDWEAAFKDLEEENKADEYFMDPEEENIWACEYCGDEFRSHRQTEIHERGCESNNEKVSEV
ncbi:hypothetical protein OAO35_00350 [Euryarchaeota archaeon]|nr:hypothetical protein [Euryarchaeota archaeon]